jgi:hypothetical protein
MRFMMFIKIDPDYEGQEPSVEEVSAMSRYNEELIQAGAMLAGDGLQPPSLGARVEFGDGGRPTVVDGPFAEAKEVIGGYWIIEVKSRDEAVAWATRVPAGAGNAIELRQIFEMADFSPEVQEAGQLSQTPPEQTSSSS